MDEIIGRIRQELISKGSEQVRKSSERFFKEPIKVRELKSADAERISKSWLVSGTDSIP